MLKITKVVFLSLFLILFSEACSIESEPIEYGKDACSFCKMNIVDRQHASEIVTKKGKVFKYDAIECMVRDIKKRNEDEIALFLIVDYATPGKLVDATKSTYLISEAIPSPMGANLSGFENKESALKIQNEKKGDLYSWDELKSRF